MKHFLLVVIVCSSMIGNAQTLYFSSSEMLNSVYENKILVDSYHSQMTEAVPYDDYKCYTISSGSKKITVGSSVYVKRSENNSALLLWNTKNGTPIRVSELGDNTNNMWVEEHFIMPNGNIFVFTRLNVTENSPLTMGTQQFSYRTDTLPSYLSAQYNLSTNEWEHVNFYYVGRKNNDNYLSEVKHIVTQSGDVFFSGRYNAPYIIINSDTIVKRTATSHPFFVCKLDSDFKKIWTKQALNVGTGTSLTNIYFGADAQDNIYIGGTLGYVNGAISIDGVVVKNDTILDEYDYTYTDLFVYKIDASGTVSMGKTFLYRGTEQLADMHVLADGSIYMVGDYSNQFVAPPVGDFPPGPGGLYYNVFLIKVNGANGSILWGQPIHQMFTIKNVYVKYV